MKKIDRIAQKNIDLWLNSPIDQRDKETIRKLLKSGPQELADAFYARLSFGTAGLRGIMGVGTNRMNKYTVMMTTQGLANYLNGKKGKKRPVIIGYDSRENSRLFAETAARVLAGNDIPVLLFSTISPTPIISFGCRLKKCAAAIVITASHNPPEYNGYKVYGDDGGQIVSPEDDMISGEIAAIEDISTAKMAASLDIPLITTVNKEIYIPYLERIKKERLYPEEDRKWGSELKISYTPLHGTGAFFLPKALRDWGFTEISFVEPQMIPDGNFPTVKYPNPEDKMALELGVETMKRTSSDILIATDPDADRVGITVAHNKEVHYLNGNQTICICLYHILEALKKQKRLTEKCAFVKTICTTELFRKMVESYGAYCEDVLTGFKYIAEKIRQWEAREEGYKFIFGGEESYGYLLGSASRDKDAIISSALICEAALLARREGKTLIDRLHEIYRQFGLYFESLRSIQFEESRRGKQKMRESMKRLRYNHPKAISKVNIAIIEDYTQSIKSDLATGSRETLELPRSDVLRFTLEDGGKVIVRPSGTEPKIKIYASVAVKKFSNIEKALERAKKKAKSAIDDLESFLINDSF